MTTAQVVADSHIHFWDTDRFDYPWLQGFSDLNRPFVHADLDVGDVQIEVFDLAVGARTPFAVSLKDVNLKVRAGEVLAVAGVAGNGSTWSGGEMGSPIGPWPCSSPGPTIPNPLNSTGRLIGQAPENGD